MNKKVFPVITDNDKRLPFYVLSVGYDWEQEHIIRDDGYYCQWIQCIKGIGEVIIHDKKYKVEEGIGILLYMDEPHSYYPITDSWIVEWIVFDGNYVIPMLEHVIGIKHSGVYYLSRPDIISSKIRAIADLADSDYTLKNLQCSGLLYSLLTDIMQYASSTRNTSALNQHSKIKPILDHIELNYKYPITLNELAKISAITPQYLSLLFKKTTNIGLSQYINLVRIKKSKELLVQEPTLTIKNIAISTGFDDVNYYCSVFKKIEKITPGQFRKLYSIKN